MSQSQLTIQPYTNRSSGRQEVVVHGPGIENPTVAATLTNLGGSLNRSLGAYEFPADSQLQSSAVRDSLARTFPEITEIDAGYEPLSSQAVRPRSTSLRATMTPIPSVRTMAPTVNPLLSNPSLTIRNLNANTLMATGGTLAVVGPSTREPAVSSRLRSLGGTYSPEIDGYQFFTASNQDALVLEEALVASFPTAAVESLVSQPVVSTPLLSRPLSPRGLSRLSKFLPENNVITEVVPTSPDLVITASTPTTSVTVETAEGAAPVVQITQPSNQLSMAPRLTTQAGFTSRTASLPPVAVTTPSLPLSSGPRTIIPSVVTSAQPSLARSHLTLSGQPSLGQVVWVNDPFFGSHEYKVAGIRELKMLDLTAVNPRVPDLVAVSQGGVWRIAGLPNSQLEFF